MKPSNGTMMDYWLDRWCFRCVHDHGYSHTHVAEAFDKGWMLRKGQA